MEGHRSLNRSYTQSDCLWGQQCGITSRSDDVPFSGKYFCVLYFQKDLAMTMRSLNAYKFSLRFLSKALTLTENSHMCKDFWVEV